MVTFEKRGWRIGTNRFLHNNVEGGLQRTRQPLKLCRTRVGQENRLVSLLDFSSDNLCRSLGGVCACRTWHSPPGEFGQVPPPPFHYSPDALFSIILWLELGLYRPHGCVGESGDLQHWRRTFIIVQYDFPADSPQGSFFPDWSPAFRSPVIKRPILPVYMGGHLHLPSGKSVSLSSGKSLNLKMHYHPPHPTSTAHLSSSESLN